MRAEAVSRQPAFPCTAVCRLRQGWQQSTLRRAHHEEARTELWDAVVGRIEDLPCAVVPSFVNLAQEAVERGATLTVVVGEGIDILQDESVRFRLTKDAGVRLQKAGGRIH